MKDLSLVRLEKLLKLASSAATLKDDYFFWTLLQLVSLRTKTDLCLSYLPTRLILANHIFIMKIIFI